MTQEGYAFIGLTAIVGGLAAVLVFATLRFMAAARDTRAHLRESGGDTAVLAAALQEAVAKLKAQERAMAARAEASERLSGEIVTSLTAGLMVVGLDGAIRILNPAGQRLLGTPHFEPGASYEALLGAGSPLADVIGESLRTGGAIVRRAVELPEPRGAATHFGVTVSPLLGDNGQPSGAICLFTDLTAVMALEEQLRLKDALARLGELTAGLAHEFRNGLATIHGYARLIDVGTLPDAQRTCVEGIRGETDALGQIVTNFLNFARPAQLAVATVDLESVLARLADDLRGDVEARGGTIDVSGAFAPLEGDEVLLRQAFSNLARNAVEACAQAGRPPRVRLEGRLDRERRTLHVSVTDNGPGIEAANREKVFRPFFTTKRDGTGLGLALVQKIVVTHNGRVVVHAAAGGGACFEIALPLAPASTPA